MILMRCLIPFQGPHEAFQAQEMAAAGGLPLAAEDGAERIAIPRRAMQEIGVTPLDGRLVKVIAARPAADRQLRAHRVLQR